MFQNSFLKLYSFFLLCSSFPTNKRHSSEKHLHMHVQWPHRQVPLASAGQWIWIHQSKTPLWWLLHPYWPAGTSLWYIHVPSLGPDPPCPCFSLTAGIDPLAHRVATARSRLGLRPGKIATVNYHKCQQRQASYERAVRKGWQVPFWALLWSLGE